jgi:hypothetical protein
MQSCLGLLILYDDIRQEEIQIVSNFVQKISEMDYIIDILRENCVITSLGLSTNQGKAVNNNNRINNNKININIFYLIYFYFLFFIFSYYYLRLKQV